MAFNSLVRDLQLACNHWQKLRDIDTIVKAPAFHSTAV